uniref:Uncharacterized protein n=1 Tax=Psilocybe cubensis TaxID=181762 RepID=A0A8H8CL07_PSICU
MDTDDDVYFTAESLVDAIISLPETGYTDALNNLLESVLRSEHRLRRALASFEEPQEIDSRLLDPYAGLIDIFAVPEIVRKARPRPWNEALFEVAIDGFVKEQFAHKHLFRLPRDLQRSPGVLYTVPSYDHFLRQWNVFTNNAISTISDWSNILVAGGAVLASLQPIPVTEHYGHQEFLPPTRRVISQYFETAYKEADVDIFLYGMNAEQNTVGLTLFILASGDTRQIQIILRLYRSPAEILAGFDIDAACCAFDGSHVILSARALVALMTQKNTVDMSRRSPSYEVRLQKYATRGFEVYLPSLDREKINYAKVYNKTHVVFGKGLERLLVYEYLRYDPLFFPYLRTQRRGRRRRRAAWFRLNLSEFDFVPMGEDSNYDRVWGRLPSHWDVDQVKAHILRMERAMNSSWKLRKYRRTAHRHFSAFSDDVLDLFDRCCMLEETGGCPEPVTERDIQLVEEEIKSLAQRLAFPTSSSFITENPGQQLLTGSFRPVTVDDWEEGAYVSDGQNPSVDERETDYSFRWMRYLKNLVQF